MLLPTILSVKVLKLFALLLHGVGGKKNAFTYNFKRKRVETVRTTIVWCGW